VEFPRGCAANKRGDMVLWRYAGFRQKKTKLKCRGRCRDRLENRFRQKEERGGQVQKQKNNVEKAVVESPYYPMVWKNHTDMGKKKSGKIQLERPIKTLGTGPSIRKGCIPRKEKRRKLRRKRQPTKTRENQGML